MRIALALVTLTISSAIHAQEAEVVRSAELAEHVSPRLKVSYRTFSIAGLDETLVRLHGVQLDAYAVSQRWLRIGFELEAGGASASWAGASATLGYGLVGLTAGVQFPARVTPFVEGRFVAGVLAGQLDGDYGPASGTVAATWLYGGGLEAGVELYLQGRTYLSASVGWMRSTWHGVDVMDSLSGTVTYKDLVADAFTVKVGIGI